MKNAKATEQVIWKVLNCCPPMALFGPKIGEETVTIQLPKSVILELMKLLPDQAWSVDPINDCSGTA